MKFKDDVFRKVYLNEGQDTLLSVIEEPKGKESGKFLTSKKMF